MVSSAVYVLVIAHPDDESMFFVPTIRSLVTAGERVWILCLTTGDYDGLGKQREKELNRAGNLLGVSKVMIVNDKDHPKERWPIPSVSSAIQQALENEILSNPECERFVLLTFDQHGVSGHVNHIDTFHGVCELVKQNSTISSTAGSNHKTKDIISPVAIEAWQLESERNLFFKYVPVLSWLLFFLALFTTTSPVLGKREDSQLRRAYRFHEPLMNWRAMAAHESQFVWYRRLFVIFSCYTYVNKLQPINKQAKLKG
jgi:N-acetylglucosaminylphosphatidylinositol deacetylase